MMHIILNGFNSCSKFNCAYLIVCLTLFKYKNLYSFVHYVLQTNAEASEDLLHVAALLHGDDTQMILLVHPDQEGLVVVVPGGRNATQF